MQQRHHQPITRKRVLSHLQSQSWSPCPGARSRQHLHQRLLASHPVCRLQTCSLAHGPAHGPAIGLRVDSTRARPSKQARDRPTREAHGKHTESTREAHGRRKHMTWLRLRVGGGHIGGMTWCVCGEHTAVRRRHVWTASRSQSPEASGLARLCALAYPALCSRLPGSVLSLRPATRLRSKPLASANLSVSGAAIAWGKRVMDEGRPKRKGTTTPVRLSGARCPPARLLPPRAPHSVHQDTPLTVSPPSPSLPNSPP